MPQAFPVEVVVGASDVPATARFLAALGFTDPAVSTLTGLPEAATVAMTVLAGPATDPPRLELLTFPDHAMEPVAPLPLRAGRMLPVFTAAAFDDTLADLGGALRSPVVGRDGGVRAVVGVAPGGVAFELREAPS